MMFGMRMSWYAQDFSRCVFLLCKHHLSALEFWSLRRICLHVHAIDSEVLLPCLVQFEEWARPSNWTRQGSRKRVYSVGHWPPLRPCTLTLQVLPILIPTRILGPLLSWCPMWLLKSRVPQDKSGITNLYGAKHRCLWDNWWSGLWILHEAMNYLQNIYHE